MTQESRGRRIADCLVIRSDPDAEAANPYYHHRIRPLLDEIAEMLDHPGFADPADVSAYRSLIGELDRTSSPVVDEVGELARVAARRSRIGYRVGAGYRPHRTVGADELETGREQRKCAGPAAGVLVVVPFRDATAGGGRFRNLLACLRALNDQSLPRDRYRICVVESDSRMRWHDQSIPFADDYLFAFKDGPFNKSWAVNVGVRNAGGAADLICVLDADALVDHHFLERNAQRFDRPGTGAFLPFRDLTYLDANATGRAIEDRCLNGVPHVGPDRLRGFVVHRSPGVCVWLHREAFDAVDGMDERFEGWGGEDIAFVTRLQLATPFLIFDDEMHHLHHEPSSYLVGGETVNAHIARFDWTPEHPIGDIDRFR